MMDYMKWLHDLLKGTYGVEDARVREAAARAGMTKRELAAVRSFLRVKTCTVWGEQADPHKMFWFLPGEGPGDPRA